MLINLRNALMAGKRLPYDAEVEYLESTGTQYVNTGVKFTTDNARVKFTASVTYAANKALCGSQNHSAENSYGFVGYLYSNAMRFYAGKTNTGMFSSLVDGNIHIVDLQANSGVLTRNVDGSISTASYSGSIVSGEDFTLFTTYTPAVSSYMSRCVSGKIYSFQIWNNGTLVRDYIPVRKSGVGYLYDRVSGKLFGNAGTGAFSYGSDVVQVEWLQSHGTEWIDLGAVVSPDTDFQFKGTIVSDNTNGCAFGESARFSWAANNPAYSLALATGGGYAYLRYGDSSANAIGVTMVGLNTPFTASLIGQDFSINGLKVATVSRINSFSSTVQTMSLFRRNYTNANSTYSIIKIESLNFGNKFHLRPVRVGTGSTWEGAMMDTLTRRIYRNAGTGAFTYGNDLKYPIPAE